MSTNRRRCSSSILDWQKERASRLHKQFVRVQAALLKGKSFGAALKVFIWFWKGKSYRCDPNRKCQFKLGNLRRLYRQWLKGGQVPAALYLHYKPTGANIPAPVVVRFMEFCASRHLPTLKAAWNEFSKKRAAYGGCRGVCKQATKFSYGQVQRYFSGSEFQAIQTTIRIEAEAKEQRARICVGLTARIQRELPPRPARARRTGADLSREASAL